MPTGSVARSFPKEEKELRSLFNKGLKKLRSIEKQDSGDNVKPTGDVQTRLGRKGDAAAAARAAKMAASLRGSRGLSSLAARSKRSSPPSQVSAVARQRQLDASYAADNKENRALSGAGDVDALFKSLNSPPAEKKARTTQLSLEASPQRRWGVVYDPAATREHALRGEAKREYDRWSQLAQTVSDVPDPSEDTAAWPGNHRSTAWWKWSRGGDSGKWWEHNHAGRGY